MLPTHYPLSRRQFISTSTAVLGSYSHSLPGLSASPLPQRPNIRYGLTTGSWGMVTPPGKSLPLLRILDETAETGFDGIRLTGFPSLLKDNNLSIRQLDEELAKRSLSFSTISFGGFYRDKTKQKEILDNLRQVMEVHHYFGATSATFFPSSDVMPGESEREVYKDTFHFYRTMGKLALEEYGVRMGIHNLPGSLVSTQVQVDRFLQNTDPQYVFCAWDTAHLLLDGCKVLDVFKNSIDRTVYLDFEDATQSPSAKDFIAPNGRRFQGSSERGKFLNSSMDLGQGDVPYPEIMAILKKANYRGWIVPDLHSVRISATESWRIAMTYIRNHLDPVYQ